MRQFHRHRAIRATGYSPLKTWTLFTGCVRAARPLLVAILRDLAAYYVNVHTTQYPAGAIRGQL